MSDTPRIAFLSPDAAEDDAAMASLARMVNAVYTVADAGLWAVPFERTNTGELVRHTRDGEIAVAVAGRDVVGCVRVRQDRGVDDGRRQPVERDVPDLQQLRWCHDRCQWDRRRRRRAFPHRQRE